MKQIIYGTGEQGNSLRILSPSNSLLSVDDDTYLGNPKNAVIVGSFTVLKGYRLVTDKEKENYAKTDNLKCYWYGKFISDLDDTWRRHVTYFVPVDYEFTCDRKPSTGMRSGNIDHGMREHVDIEGLKRHSEALMVELAHVNRKLLQAVASAVTPQDHITMD